MSRFRSTSRKGNDAGWYTAPETVLAPETPAYQLYSEFITMSDGVRLAADIYLPGNFSHSAAASSSQHKLPTFLHFTRYNRGWQLRWPFNWCMGGTLNARSNLLVHRFVTEPLWRRPLHAEDKPSQPYAFVTVDVRGTGASFGVRHVDFSQREKQDFQVLLSSTHTFATTSDTVC